MRTLINVSRGILPIYHDVYGHSLRTNVIISVFPLRWTIGASVKNYDTGVSLYIPSQRAITAQYLEPKVKNRSRLYYQMANLEMREIGPHAWALLLDQEGFITEGTGSNFFLIKNKKIYTPEGRNILRGISRDYVMKIALDLGYEVVEKNMELYDVYTADEAFLTSTPYCIVPAVSINGSLIGGGLPGPITGTLLEHWGKLNAVDIVGQARYYAETGTASSSNPFVELRR
jgi:branched-chain amino acid aminotransferase